MLESENNITTARQVPAQLRVHLHAPTEAVREDDQWESSAAAVSAAVARGSRCSVDGGVATGAEDPEEEAGHSGVVGKPAERRRAEVRQRLPRVCGGSGGSGCWIGDLAADGAGEAGAQDAELLVRSCKLARETWIAREEQERTQRDVGKHR